MNSLFNSLKMNYVYLPIINGFLFMKCVVLGLLANSSVIDYLKFFGVYFTFRKTKSLLRDNVALHCIFLFVFIFQQKNH